MSSESKRSVTFVKVSDYNDVRLQKFLKVAQENSWRTTFIGMSTSKVNFDESFSKPHSLWYACERPSDRQGSKSIAYMRFFLRVFFHALLTRKTTFYCADFEAALPITLSKIFFRRHKLIYDIYDEITLRYRLPKFLSLPLGWMDALCQRLAVKVIVVSQERAKVSTLVERNKLMIIENLPIIDHAKLPPQTPNFPSKRTFAVVGYLERSRGLESILRFAESNLDIDFIFAGRFVSPESERRVRRMNNCVWLGSVAQSHLYANIAHVNGIFSLYDPTIEINRLAASNKLYDAMALGIPIITNPGIQASDYVRRNKIGVIVPYDYEEDEWSVLREMRQEELKSLGVRGKLLFDNMPKFQVLASNVFPKVTA